MFSILLWTTRGINIGILSLICVVLFSNKVVHFIKKVHETYWCSSSTACQERRTDWILRIFPFNDKNQLYLPIILTIQFFEVQNDQAVTQLVIKPFSISQTLR